LKNHKKIPLLWAAACMLLMGMPDIQMAQTPQLEQPLLITSAGQSAEVQLAAVLAKRAELDYTLAKLATSEDLSGKKTLVLSLGASLKGLGAAGLDVAQEYHEVPLLALHQIEAVLDYP